MQASLLAQGFDLMVFGMGTVFLFLALLVLLTSLMSALVQRFSPPQPNPDAASSSPASPGQEQLLAVITAAVHKYRSRRKP